MANIPVALPLTPAALYRFGVEAKSEGVSLEAYLNRLSECGFGVPLAELLSTVFHDAADAAAFNKPSRNRCAS